MPTCPPDGTPGNAWCASQAINQWQLAVNVTIRPATIEDHQHLTKLIFRSKRSNGYDDAFMQACRAELRVSKADILADEYWLACIERQVGAQRVESVLCGCVCLTTGAKNVAEVSAFFIDPGYQRQGLGRLLWNKLLERAEALGITRIVLDSDPNAVAFYQALGFQVVGNKPSGSIAGRLLPHLSISL